MRRTLLRHPHRRALRSRIPCTTFSACKGLDDNPEVMQAGLDRGQQVKVLSPTLVP